MQKGDDYEYVLRKVIGCFGHFYESAKCLLEQMPHEIP
jgi:hypothetical protein